MRASCILLIKDMPRISIMRMPIDSHVFHLDENPGHGLMLATAAAFLINLCRWMVGSSRQGV